MGFGYLPCLAQNIGVAHAKLHLAGAVAALPEYRHDGIGRRQPRWNVAQALGSIHAHQKRVTLGKPKRISGRHGFVERLFIRRYAFWLGLDLVNQHQNIGHRAVLRIGFQFHLRAGAPTCTQ